MKKVVFNVHATVKKVANMIKKRKKHAIIDAFIPSHKKRKRYINLFILKFALYVFLRLFSMITFFIRQNTYKVNYCAHNK